MKERTLQETKPGVGQMIGDQIWYCFYHQRVLNGHMGARPNDCGAPDYLECIVKVALPVAEDGLETYAACGNCGNFLDIHEMCPLECKAEVEFITVIEDA